PSSLRSPLHPSEILTSFRSHSVLHLKILAFPHPYPQPLSTLADSMASSTLDDSMNIAGPPLLHFEHFNFDVPSPHLASLFYSSLLSCTLDPGRTALHSTTLWMNLGICQIHLP